MNKGQVKHFDTKAKFLRISMKQLLITKGKSTIMQNTLWYTAFLIALLVQIISGICIYILLFFINAPYGRYVSKKFGCTMNPHLGWILMELPAFAVVLFFYIHGIFTGALSDSRSPIVMLVFFVLWEIHYFNRSFIYPFIMSKKANPMAVIIPIFGMSFNMMNSFINGYYLFSGRNIFFENTIFEINIAHLYTIEWLSDPRFSIGLVIFILGMTINMHSDRILCHLRTPDETEYTIPHKGLHKFVASPNYFGEILEWTGFAILTWSLPAAAFAFHSFCNLAPRAWNNKKWYRSHFGDAYPAKRKALIPFVF